MTKNKDTSWDSSNKWYNASVGEKGHYYHQTIILKKVVPLLDLKKEDSLLDLGCGQGVLQRHLPKTIHYTGVDNSKALLKEAKRMSKGEFIHADVCKKYPLNREFDAACFILSLQNMEHPEKALLQTANHLKKEGKLLLVLNHPCFRIPRQSNWGIDEKAKLQYRRMNMYMSPLSIPIQTHPSKGEESALTYTFHHPLSFFVNELFKNGLMVSKMEEWCSDKESTGSKAKMEGRARKEFPLFLAIMAHKR